MANDWLLFLEFIGLGRVMEGASLDIKSSIGDQLASYFDSSNPWNLDQVNQLIDTAYKDCLIECQNINKLAPATLIAKYEAQRKYCIGKASALLVPTIAERYAEALRNNPSVAHFNLCLNLAWQLLSWRLASMMAQTSIKQHPSRIFELFQPLIAVWYQIALDHGNQPTGVNYELKPER